VAASAELPASWLDTNLPLIQAAEAKPRSAASADHPSACRGPTGGCEQCERHHLFARLEREAGLQYVGCVGLEDQLQALVPETIRDCLSAGIKVWMITGDKLEAAKNIGLACNLIDPDMVGSCGCRCCALAFGWCVEWCDVVVVVVAGA
jgi:hypothetical protein